MKLKDSLEKRLRALKATNDMGAAESFYKRLAYTVYSCHDIREDTLPTMMDFNVFEGLLYGRVDTNYRCVEVVPSRLVEIEGTKNKYVLPYVAAAFSEFKKEINTAIINGKIRNAPFLENMEVARAFTSARNAYVLNLSILGSRFLNFYIKTRRLDEIRDFDSFMIKFTDFVLETSLINPISSPAFLMSKSCSILSTGLAIDLQEFDASLDEEKMKIITSPFFQFYVDVATKFGFYVDKNYPCRLVANLSSRAMATTADENGYNIAGAFSYFSADYSVCWRDDLDIFKNMAYQLYSYIQDRRPDIYEVFVQDSDLYTKIEEREYILPIDVVERYPDDYWINFYVRLRNNETRLNFDEPSLNKITQNAIDRKKMLDIHGIMDYINRVFMDVPAQEGSLNDFKNRKYFKDQEEVPFSDYQEYLAKTIKIKR